MLRFSKPKNPGFGIDKDYFLSVLSSSSILPPLLAVVNPSGDGGAVPGLGAPLLSSATKDALSEPLVRGAYVVSTKDRKTVLQMLIVSKEEAGYDPEAFARSDLATGAEPELMARLRGTWTLTQFRFKSHDPAVFPALQFLLSVCVRLAMLAEGVVADPISQRYLLPGDALHPTLGDPPIDVRDLVVVKVAGTDAGLTAYTLGMQKLSLPEFEILGLTEAGEADATRFLLGLCQWVIRGNLLQPGVKVGDPTAPMQVAVGGFDRGRWEGTSCFELLPPTRMTADEALATWRASADQAF
ncbi:MAG: hypothetical protein ACYC96_03530 [Fimbriimonadaceae bacterium]